MQESDIRELVRSTVMEELAKLKKKKKRTRSSSSSSSSSSRTSSCSSERGRRKKRHKKKGKHKRHHSPSRVGSSGSRGRQRSLSPACSTCSGKSFGCTGPCCRGIQAALPLEEESDLEEEEILPSLSEAEQGDDMGEDSPSLYGHLFPEEDFHILLDSVMATLDIKSPAPASEEPEEQAKEKVLPIPRSLQKIVLAEWDAPGTSKRLPSIPKQFFGSPGALPDMWSVPAVELPVTALVSSQVISKESDTNLKHTLDRKIEFLLKKSFEADSLAARASANCSLFARAGLQWMDAILADPGMSGQSKNQLTEIRKILAFCADTTLDALQLTARATASSTAARRALWLRHWKVDNASKLQVVTCPFKGTQLFEEDVLQGILVEDKNEKEVMPSSTQSQGTSKGKGKRSLRQSFPESQLSSPRGRSRGRAGGSSSTRQPCPMTDDDYFQLWLDTYQVKKPPPPKRRRGRPRYASPAEAFSGDFTIEEIISAATWDKPSPFTIHYGLEQPLVPEPSNRRLPTRSKRYNAR